MLEVKNLSVTLDGDKGKVQVLKEINLSLENKKIYVMTGPNGGGKSSVARSIKNFYWKSQICMGHPKEHSISGKMVRGLSAIPLYLISGRRIDNE